MPDGSVEQKKDNWRKEDAEEGPRRFWTGFSEFKLKPRVSKEKINWSMLARKSSDEVKDHLVHGTNTATPARLDGAPNDTLFLGKPAVSMEFNRHYGGLAPACKSPHCSPPPKKWL